MPEERYLRGIPDVHRAIGSTLNRWYIAGQSNCLALTTNAPTVNNLRAIPLLVPKKITLDRIAINVTTLIAGKARLGLYNDNALYPSSLILDSGELDTGTTGVKSATISQTLNPGLYWAVHVGNAAPTLRALAAGGQMAILGTDSGIGTATGVGRLKSFTYAALPDPFPEAGTVLTGTVPVIAVRLSA